VTKLNIPKGQDYFELLVWLPGRGPLRDIFKGDTVLEAMQVAKLRHAGCRVDIPPLVVRRSTLVRSENYGRPTPTRRRTQRNA
jgi:hypothetical protein